MTASYMTLDAESDVPSMYATILWNCSILEMKLLDCLLFDLILYFSAEGMAFELAI